MACSRLERLLPPSVPLMRLFLISDQNSTPTPHNYLQTINVHSSHINVHSSQLPPSPLVPGPSVPIPPGLPTAVPRAPVPSCLFANLSSPWGPWGIGTGSTLGTYPVVPIMCFALAGRSFSFTAASGIGTKAVRSRGCRNPEGNSGGQNSRGINNGIARTWRASLIGAGSAKSTQLADGWINHIPTFT